MFVENCKNLNSHWLLLLLTDPSVFEIDSAFHSTIGWSIDQWNELCTTLVASEVKHHHFLIRPIVRVLYGWYTKLLTTYFIWRVYEPRNLWFGPFSLL